MPKVITFSEALTETEGRDRALLIGNGFSANYFHYKTLLAASDIDHTSGLGKVFQFLDTVDFEKVVRALEGASLVESAYGNVSRADELTGDAQRVREALVGAVKKTHPAHRKDLDYSNSSTFLSNFNSVFSLNYDLLLYWTILEKRRLTDGFGLGTDSGWFRGPFKIGAYCAVYNVHGGMHLFENENGGVDKALDEGDGVIANIADAIENKKLMPLYVAEGSSNQKLKIIESNYYLRFCMEKLRENAASVFVYGHSADDNDEHIYRAIFESSADCVYFGVYPPDCADLSVYDGQLAKFQKKWGPKKQYKFFDSASASVW